MKVLLAVSLTSFCVVLVSAPLIRRRETIEKLVEFNVAVPSLLRSWQQGSMYPIGYNHAIRQWIAVLSNAFLGIVQSLSLVPSESGLIPNINTY